MGPEHLPVGVISESPDHFHWITETRDGDGLIGSFAAGMNLKAAAGDGLAGEGNVFDRRDEVGVDAADDDNRLQIWHAKPPRTTVGVGYRMGARATAVSPIRKKTNITA